LKETERIIPSKKSVIVAADVLNIRDFRKLAMGTIGVPGISAIKFGFTLGLDGIKRAVDVVHNINAGITSCLSLYDHQKAGNDIPAMGAKFAWKLKKAGIDAVILFPFTGPVTQTEWTKACQGEGLKVITGGIMTHQQFLVSEGGYIADDAPERIYTLAADKLGVRHFVVPGNKLHWVQKIKTLLDELLGPGMYVLYGPGFVKQGGDVTECGRIAGDEFHAIIGSAIYGSDEMLNPVRIMKANACQLTSQLLAA
jgi:orotidine-5'-phosphate decarboxylase